MNIHAWLANKIIQNNAFHVFLDQFLRTKHVNLIYHVINNELILLKEVIVIVVDLDLIYWKYNKNVWSVPIYKIACSAILKNQINV